MNLVEILIRLFLLQENLNIIYNWQGTGQQHFEIVERLWRISTHFHMPANQTVVLEWYD
jgi:hypothetical protein